MESNPENNSRRASEEFNRLHLHPTSQSQTIAQAVAEGNLLLEQAGTSSIAPETSRLEEALGNLSHNPYVRARMEILKKLPHWKQAEIREMERTKNTDNRFYADFAHEVRKLGDSFQA